MKRDILWLIALQQQVVEGVSGSGYNGWVCRMGMMGVLNGNDGCVEWK